LGLTKASSPEIKIPGEIIKMLEGREELRKQGKFDEADDIRKKIERLGYKVDDATEGPRVKPVQNGK
jgi:cysteinyl-tRNA synthetase